MDSPARRDIAPYPPLSAVQQVIVQHYADGDYQSVVRSETDARNMDDGLLTFLMGELGPGTGCDSSLEAVRRLDMAIKHLEAVRSALYAGVSLSLATG